MIELFGLPPLGWDDLPVFVRGLGLGFGNGRHGVLRRRTLGADVRRQGLLLPLLLLFSAALACASASASSCQGLSADASAAATAAEVVTAPASWGSPLP